MLFIRPRTNVTHSFQTGARGPTCCPKPTLYPWFVNKTEYLGESSPPRLTQQAEMS